MPELNGLEKSLEKLRLAKEAKELKEKEKLDKLKSKKKIKYIRVKPDKQSEPYIPARELRPLNLQEEKFVIKYLESNDSVQSYIDAGYAEHSAAANATRMLAKPHIIKYINEHNNILANKMMITREEIIDRINKRSELVLKLQELALILEPTEDQLSQFKRLSSVLKVSDGNKSDEILAKMLGYNEPEKVETKITWEVGFGVEEDNKTVIEDSSFNLHSCLDEEE